LTGGSVVGWMRQYGTEYIDWQAQAPLSFSAAALLLVLVVVVVMLQHGSSSVVSYRWSHECAGRRVSTGGGRTAPRSSAETIMPALRLSRTPKSRNGCEQFA